MDQNSTTILPDHTISNLINQELRDYSLYVVKHRALPSFVDGFKSTARILFWLMYNNSNEIKVSALSGRAADKGGYHHGSADGSIVTMTQSFPGTNNIPWFIGRGEFGSVQNKNASASRYIFAKYNKLMNYIYLDTDLHKPALDMENPEPLHFYPIIPMLLINNIQGIATGHACKFQSYNPIDVLRLTRDILNNKDIGKMNILKPYYLGYTGDILFNEEKFRWDMFGKWEKINESTLRITEVPIAYSRESYLKYLVKLKTKKLIASYIEEKIEKGQNWNIIIKLARKSKAWDDPIRIFALRRRLPMNMSCISEDDKVIKYEYPEEIAIDFTFFRLKIYHERIKFNIAQIQKEIEWNYTKIKFVELMSNLNFKSMTSKEIKSYCIENGFVDKDELNKLMQLPITILNKNGIEKFLSKIKNLKSELDYYKNTTAEKLYNIDLNVLQKQLNKNE